MSTPRIIGEAELRRKLYALLRECAAFNMSPEYTLGYMESKLQGICSKETIIEVLRDMAKSCDNRRFASPVHHW